MTRGGWLLLGLLGCASPSRGPVHAEAWVAPGTRDANELRALLASAPVSADGPGRDGRIRVIGSRGALADLEDLGLEVEVTRPDHRSQARRAPEYHDEDQMVDVLWDMAEAYPERVEILDLGRSVEGRPLLGLRIGQGEWRVRLLGTHHGDELASSEVTLAVAQQLIREPIPVEVWVVPHVNPDGVADGSRYNARDVDLNRNYGFQWNASEYRAGEEPFSEPESRAVRVLSAYRGFASGLSLHSGAALICYIWNYTTTNSADEDLLVAQSEAYRQQCGVSGFYLINGGAWYVTYGDTSDWSYGRRGTFDYTLEVSVEKTPPASVLEGLIDDHMDAVLDFVEREPSVVGVVRDAEDGSPVEAIVDIDGGWASTAGPDGRFARWLVPGEVTIDIRAPGYETRRVELDVQAGELQSLDLTITRQDLVELRPEPALVTWGDQAREVTLPGIEDEQITLFRPGYGSVLVEREGHGYAVVPSELAPGPWGISTAQGSTPRALFVGERDDRVTLDSVSWHGGELGVEGQGFEVGSRAWAIGGLSRAMTPLELLESSGTSLRWDAGPLEDLDGTIDLLVVSSGAQLAALDLASGAVVDTGAPSDTEPPEPDSEPAPGDSRPGVVARGTCGCAASSDAGLAPTLFLVTLATAFGLRRRERNPHRSHVSLEAGLPRSQPDPFEAPWEQ